MLQKTTFVIQKIFLSTFNEESMFCWNHRREYPHDHFRFEIFLSSTLIIDLTKKHKTENSFESP
jgi:hypothetical protein